MRSQLRTLIIIAIIIGSILVSLFANLAISLVQKSNHPKKYEELVTKYASEYNVPEYIIYAVINIESEFDPNAKSADGSCGLMQISPMVFKTIASYEHLNESTKFDELTKPDVAIRYGAYYLRYLFNKFHKWDVAFAAYDAGEEQVLEWLDDAEYSKNGESLSKIPLKETRNYVKRVNKATSYYKNTYYKNGVSVK